MKNELNGLRQSVAMLLAGATTELNLSSYFVVLISYVQVQDSGLGTLNSETGLTNVSSALLPFPPCYHIMCLYLSQH